METTENFLQNCLYWHTEISIYRCRINQMQKQLQDLKPKIVNSRAYTKYTLVVQGIQEALSKLKSIEYSVINIIRENINSPSHPQLLHIKSTVNSEDDLFHDMKNCYSLFINLQKSFNYYLKESSVSKSKSKVIEFPVERRVQKDAAEIVNRSLYINQGQLEMKR